MCVLAFFLLSALSSAGAEELSVFIIDPGHGGYDVGIKGTSVKEKELTLSMARQIKEILEGLDREVALTRKIDHYLTIEERRTIANRGEPDLFLSLHMSDSDFFAVYVMWYEKKDLELSLEEYYSIASRQRRYLYESNLLSQQIAGAFKEEWGVKVSLREMPLPILSSIGMPAVLIEVPSRGIDYSGEMLRVASTIVIGLLNYEAAR